MQSEKAIATHSSTLAWQIPWVEEPGGLQSMGLLRVGHDWATSLSLFTFLHWRRKWQPTPVFLPGESQGRGAPDGLPSMGSHRVGHDWSDLAAAVIVCVSNNITIMSNNNIKAYEKEFICSFYRRGYWGSGRRTDWTIITQLVEIYLVLKLVSSDLKFWGTFYYIILFV